MRGALLWSTFLLDDIGFRRFKMNGGTMEESLATRAGRHYEQYRDGDQA